MWMLLNACAGPYVNYGAERCHVETIGGAVPADTPTALGFSAVEVVPLVDGTFEVSVEPPDDGPLETATFTFSTRDPGEAQVEEWVLNLDTPLARRHCLAGPTLWFPATFDVAATRTAAGVEEDWFTASGEVRIGAQGLDSQQIWIDASIPAAPEEDLAEVAEGEVPEWCDPSEATLEFHQSNLPWAPWAMGPVGALGLVACEERARITVYRWGDALPPPLDSGT